jgi:hypothetical protein
MLFEGRRAFKVGRATVNEWKMITSEYQGFGTVSEERSG